MLKEQHYPHGLKCKTPSICLNTPLIKARSASRESLISVWLPVLGRVTVALTQYLCCKWARVPGVRAAADPLTTWPRLPMCPFVYVRVHVFSGEKVSKDLYAGHLMPEARVHICLSRPNETSHVCECVWALFLPVTGGVGTQQRVKSAIIAHPLSCKKTVISHYWTFLLAQVGERCVCVCLHT